MKRIFHIAGENSARQRFTRFAAISMGFLLFIYLMLFKVALPLFISTASVRTNMEHALSSWTGATARIDGTPIIGFWPQPVLTLQNITFEGGNSAQPEALAKANAITAKFDVLAALRGDPVFYDFRLVGPNLKIRREADGSLNWRRAGWMAEAVSATASSKAAPEKDTPIGEIEIEDGAINLADVTTGKTYSFNGISGVVDWPSPSSRISGKLEALLHGEKVDWSFSSENPMELLSGRSSAIETTVASPLLSLEFRGNARGSAYGFFTGQLQASAGDLSKAMSWLGSDLPTMQTALAVTIDTRVVAQPGMLKMDELSLSLNDMSATGALDVTRTPGGEPHIDGTVAFDRMDVGTLAPHLVPWLLGSGDNGLLDRVTLDIRLSAPEIIYGTTIVTDVAAGIMTSGQRASIDIGDGTYAGGSLSGRLAVLGHGSSGGQLQLTLKDADLGVVAGTLGLPGPLPIGRGIASIDFATSGPVERATIDNVSGTIRYTASDGTIPNFNLQAFESLMARNAFFNIGEAGNGSLAFTTANIEASLEGGVAEIRRADIRTADATLSLAGIVPYKNGSLALAGAIQPTTEGALPSRFFVGGTWPDAIISPLTTIPASP